jgi:drug/metabolite transporter (DMT)-like permease
MESIGNIWVVILSFLFFREPITRGKVLGNALIFLGIVIFYLNWAEISPSLEFLVTDFGTLFSSLG